MTIRQQIVIKQGEFIDDKNKYPSTIFMCKETWERLVLETISQGKARPVKKEVLQTPVMISKDVPEGEVLIG